MGIFIITFLTLGAISASMVYLTSLNDISSRSSNSKVQGRVLANTIADYVFSKVQEDPRYVEYATNNCSSNIGFLAKNPGLNCDNAGISGAILQQNGISGSIGKTFDVVKNNLSTNLDVSNYAEFKSVTDCKLQTRIDCASYFLVANKLSNSGIGVDRVIGAKLIIKVYSGCYSAKVCRKTTYGTTIKPINFFDFMYYTKYSTMDPEFYSTLGSFGLPTTATKTNCSNTRNAVTNGCLTVNLTKLDLFSGGDIYTYDDYLYVCGDPIISGRIYSYGASRSDSNSVKTESPTPSCPNTSINQPYNQVINLDLKLEGGANSKVTKGTEKIDTLNLFNLPASGTASEIFISIVNNNLSTSESSCSSVTPFGRSLNSANGAVIVIGGNATICNITNIQSVVSIVVGGKAVIEGEITRDTTQKSAVGIIADSQIEISQLPHTCSAPSPSTHEKKINAFMLSMNRSIFVSNWYDDKYTAGNLTCPAGVTFKPTLKIEGALIGKYQPIFGSYDSSATNSDVDLLSGYIKDFKFDSRIKNGTISLPYFIPPRIGQWVKLSLSEITSNF